ncbi:MAG: hypothetical protein J5722_04820 [Oscillospiraceae bacterium]|nr:hypothetical protein [Oscillospiraceae bacterium]
MRLPREVLSKYQALLESGAITQEEYDRIAANKPAGSDAWQNLPKRIRIMRDCCSAVMLISVLTFAMTLIFIPKAPKLSEYDIGNALLYTAGKLLWLTLGIHGSIVLFALALRARKMYENTAVGSEGKTDDRHARNTLIWSAVLLTVIVLRQAFRYCYPLGTP